MSPEAQSSDEVLAQRIRELSGQIEEETQIWSGSFDRAKGYQEIVDYAESALPPLLEDLQTEGGWWRIQAISHIAYSLDKTIVYDEENNGIYQESVKTILSWGHAQGYLPPQTD